MALAEIARWNIFDPEHVRFIRDCSFSVTRARSFISELAYSSKSIISSSSRLQVDFNGVQNADASDDVVPFLHCLICVIP